MKLLWFMFILLVVVPVVATMTAQRSVEHLSPTRSIAARYTLSKTFAHVKTTKTIAIVA